MGCPQSPDQPRNWDGAREVGIHPNVGDTSKILEMFRIFFLLCIQRSLLVRLRKTACGAGDQMQIARQLPYALYCFFAPTLDHNKAPPANSLVQVKHYGT